MPELPDLEIAAENLQKRFSGKNVKDIKFFKSNIETRNFTKSIQNKILKEVCREGKELRFHFSDDKILGLHLMLKGKIFDQNEFPELKSNVFEIIFSDGTAIGVNDIFKKARPLFDLQKNSVPDALSRKVTSDFLKEKFRRVNKPVKEILMDQHVIRGIGNAYADEILYDCKIAPDSTASAIPVAKLNALALSIKKVLREAIKSIRKIDPPHITGEIRSFLKVHRKDIDCTSAGEEILKMKINGRGTYYTARQKKYT